jgi:hypothetical protein
VRCALPRSVSLVAVAIVAIVAIGCGGAELPLAESESESESGSPAELRPNWHEDIAPIVHARCVGCHDDGSLAPFSLRDYADAASWATLVAEVVATGQMPPWGAHETDECQPKYGWVHDRRLAADEIAALSEWAQLGGPEGDPADATPLPEPAETALLDVSEVFENPAPIVLEGAADRFECVSIDTGLDRDVWITGVELLPDNAAVVHHVLVFLDELGASAALADPDGRYPCDQLPMGSLLGSYFPGSAPTELPEQVGVRFPIGARIVLNYHYHPSGAGIDVDQSRLAVRWTETPPAYDALISSVGNATSAAGGLLPGPNDPDGVPTFRIPAGARDHTETMQVTVPEWFPAAELFMLGPHMHNLAVDLHLTRTRAGETECLIQDPRWDPDWQSVYRIDAEPGELPTLIPGDVLTLRCTYDNSLANPNALEALAKFGLDAPITATMGSAGLDEMCMFTYGVATPRRD